MNGLRLHLDRTTPGNGWEEPCKNYYVIDAIGCRNGKLAYPDGSSPRFSNDDACPACHGTGSRAAWVEGSVEVGFHSVKHMNYRRYIWIIGVVGLYSNLEECEKALVYRTKNNLLPTWLKQSPDNPDGLRVCMESACKLIDHDVDDKLRELSRRRRPHWRGRAGEQFEEGEK